VTKGGAFSKSNISAKSFQDFWVFNFMKKLKFCIFLAIWGQRVALGTG
tara:strand:- start:366 stop:509 length:144 start_codon:yes stop_codon:yes gene_type:complete